MVKWILDSVKEQEPDADIEIVALGGLDIRYCIACYRCFTRGGCVIDDDVRKSPGKKIEAIRWDCIWCAFISLPGTCANQGVVGQVSSSMSHYPTMAGREI